MKNEYGSTGCKYVSAGSHYIGKSFQLVSLLKVNHKSTGDIMENPNKLQLIKSFLDSFYNYPDSTMRVKF